MANRIFLACLGLIAATSASAQFQSLVVEEVNNRAAGRQDLSHLRKWSGGRVSTRLRRWRGLPRSRARRRSTSTRRGQCGQRAAALHGAGLDDGLQYDSWVTIGYEDNYMNALYGLPDGLQELRPAAASTPTTALGSVTPDMRQAAAGPDGKLLLMQLTTEGEITGRINLHGDASVPLPR